MTARGAAGGAGRRPKLVRILAQAALSVAVLSTAFLGSILLLRIGLPRVALHGVDAALADMETMLRKLEEALGPEPPTATIAIATQQEHYPTWKDAPPPFDCSQVFDEEADWPILDPWGRGYYALVVNGRATTTAICVSSGPNGVFESRPHREGAEGDDLLVERRLFRR